MEIDTGRGRREYCLNEDDKKDKGIFKMDVMYILKIIDGVLRK